MLGRDAMMTIEVRALPGANCSNGPSWPRRCIFSTISLLSPWRCRHAAEFRDTRCAALSRSDGACATRSPHRRGQEVTGDGEAERLRRSEEFEPHEGDRERFRRECLTCQGRLYSASPFSWRGARSADDVLTSALRFFSPRRYGPARRNLANAEIGGSIFGR
jgi:hypothetical protein